MFDAFEETNEFRMLMEIAEALREEFGLGIDAHPGGAGTEVGVVNRAFRATARCILGGVVTAEVDLAVVLMWALHQVAERRLGEVGVASERAKGLIDEEPGLGEAWLAYLVLAPQTIVEDLLGGVGRE